MSQTVTGKPVQLTRQHEIYRERHDQIERNQMAANGGVAYIKKRLTRHLNESNLSWEGTKVVNGQIVKVTEGRPERTCLVNDAARIVNKFTQYLFQTQAKRDGVNDDWKQNAYGGTKSLTELWIDVNNRLTTSQWVWLQVDHTAPIGSSASLTEYDVKINGYRVVWRMWDALSVPDWYFGNDGKLNYIIVRSFVYDNSNPAAEPITYELRTLFYRNGGKVFISEFSDKPEFVKRTDVELSGISEIPFVLVGTPSKDGWWFDDIEMIQARCLNLGSTGDEYIGKIVYPQWVLPASILNDPTSKLVEVSNDDGSRKISGVGLEITRSWEIPIFEGPEDKSITRNVPLDTAGLKIIPERIAELRKELYKMAGLALFNEQRQIQTAESKQFDHLDTSSTLKTRATLLQESEARMVEISVMFDPGFAKYEPIWPDDFDVSDFATVMGAITQMANLPDQTLGMRKKAMLAASNEMSKVCKFPEGLDKETTDEILAFGGGGDDDDDDGDDPV